MAMGRALDGAQAIAAALRPRLEDHRVAGSLRFYGEWLGKPMDDWHTFVAASADDDVLTVETGDGGTLVVHAPRRGNYLREPDGSAVIGSFTIRDAELVRWSQHPYGGPQVPETERQLRYRVANGRVHRTESVGGAIVSETTLRKWGHRIAVELVRYEEGGDERDR